jgi:hypothetical protein
MRGSDHRKITYGNLESVIKTATCDGEKNQACIFTVVCLGVKNEFVAGATLKSASHFEITSRLKIRCVRGK